MDFATIMTPSNSSAIAERRTDLKQNAATYVTIKIKLHNLYHKHRFAALYFQLVLPKTFKTFIGDISVVLLSASDGAGAG